MKLFEYLKDNPVSAAVLFTDRVSKANALIRQLNNAENIVCADLTVSTVRDLAKEIVTAYLAYHNPEAASKIRFISPKACEYILMNILRDNAYASFRLSSLSAVTVKDIMNCMNDIRANGLTEEGKSADNPRLKDLLSVLSLFEGELDRRSLYDDIKSVAEAADYLQAGDVSKWMFGLADKKYLVLAGDRFSCHEREFMSCLASISGNELIEAEYISEFTKAGIHSGYCIYRSYGIANEVRLAADQIYDRKNHSAKIPYDSVNVYYSDPKYINFIKAQFDAFHIPYKIRSKNPPTELNIIRFMLSCLECAEDDMLYAKLEKVVLNPLATFKNINEDNVASNPIRAYYNALSAGIGWGRERYKAYIDNAGDGSDQFFISFLKEFIGIFDESNSCSQILSGLIDFTDKFTYKQNPDKRLVKEELRKQVNNLKYVEDSSYEMPYKISIVREVIESLMITDDSDDNCVSVSSVDDALVIERPVNYFLGMSAGDFSVDSKQSPILLDNEKTLYIMGAKEEGSSVELAGRRNERRKLALKKALLCLENNKYEDSGAVFTYMSFDTTTLRDSSPSVVLYEIMQETGCKEEKADGYEAWESYVGSDINISTSELKDSVRDRAGDIEKEREEKRAKAGRTEACEEETGEVVDEETASGNIEETFKDNTDLELTEDGSKEPEGQERNISASGLQIMLACPLKYYYRYVCHLKDVSQIVPESHVWLGAAQKGTFCHRVMEGYFNEAMPPAKQITGGIDFDVFDRIFDTELANIQKEQPYPSEPIKKREEDYYRRLMINYLELELSRFIKDRGEGRQWQVIGCELGFGRGYLNPDGELLIHEGNYNGESYKMPIDGSIDRLDGYLEGNVLKLRIVDYKTGRLSGKKEEIALGIQIQQYMYAMAAIDFLRSDKGKDRLTEVFGTVPAGYEFESICYSFPYETDPCDILETIEDVKKMISGEPDPGKMKVDFPEDINRQIVNTITRWNAGETDGIAEYIEKEIKNKIDARYEYLYEEALKKARKSNPNADEPAYDIKFGQKEFCEKNYCAYKDVCRKWVDVAAMDGTDEEDE
ncbi:MAG: PD-(D/E)XK nuclease family protein [Lachnospiraceae bacterium]|nr:PD-(D/E)XK nuclease family protein [Lachnospiraceae bacterium]